jgi:hypothetical protein
MPDPGPAPGRMGKIFNSCLTLFLIMIMAAWLPCTAMGVERIEQIPTPAGFTRLVYPSGSFSRYLQLLPLKQDNTIRQYDGRTARTALYNVLAVVDKPLLFQNDLEQCADLCMRFWADYHQDSGLLDKLFLYNYSGEKRFYKNSGKSFRQFLKWHMAHANSHSIKAGALPVADEPLDPGVMFVQNSGGGIGHVSLIVDAARDKNGHRVFLVGFSFMPAQQFHLEKASDSHGIQGWFTRQGYEAYLAGFPFNHYGTPVLRRF